MILVAIFGSIGVGLWLVVEFLRWTLRPEARRLRTIKKLGSRR